MKFVDEQGEGASLSALAGLPRTPRGGTRAAKSGGPRAARSCTPRLMRASASVADPVRNRGETSRRNAPNAPIVVTSRSGTRRLASGDAGDQIIVAAAAPRRKILTQRSYTHRAWSALAESTPSSRWTMVSALSGL